MFIIIRKKILKKFLVLFFVLLLIAVLIYMKTSTQVQTDVDKTGYVVIIIDDFGNHNDGVEAMTHLGIPITAAVMPFLPHSESDADLAHDNGLEVILHVPMEPLKGKRSWLGPRSITTDLSDEQIESNIRDGLAQIKWAVGMNNHMGSKVMQDTRVTKDVFKVAKENNLYFVDSKTTPSSVAKSIANDLNVSYYSRDIFLDGTKNVAHIEKQLDKLADLALKKGYAIGIGHVGADGGTATAEAINAKFPEMKKRGVRFVYISQLR